MEHEVNVPSSVASVRAALAEPGRVARCVPGLQLDGAEGAESTSGAGGTGSASGGSTAEGRLRVRVGGSTITYRGSLTVTSRGEEFTVKGRGTEARGTGSVKLDLTVVPRRSKEGEGTRLVCTGTVKADGRMADVEQKTAAAAGHRLLERFGKALGESIEQDPPRELDAPGAPAAEAATDEPAADQSPAAEPTAGEPVAGPTGGIGEPGDNDRVIPGIPGPDKSAEQTGAEDAPDASQSPDSSDERSSGEDREEDQVSGDSGDSGEEKAGRQHPERGGIFGTEVPPSSLDPLHDDEPLDEADVEAAAEAEAAHARRTMIGRSAEEVDHAPPRGRYAPVPLPEPIANSAALRWVAPAAAAVVAGAVVIGRALRRRR
jgi:carbon monoxide dehydrogenase subunit G